jgi:hypothetical protein
MIEATSEVSDAANKYSSEKDNKKRLELAAHFYNKTHSFIENVVGELSKLGYHYDLRKLWSTRICLAVAAAILLDMIILKVAKSFVGFIVTDSILAPLLIASVICIWMYSILRYKMSNLINELLTSEDAFSRVIRHQRIQDKDQEPITVAPPLGLG